MPVEEAPLFQGKRSIDALCKGRAFPGVFVMARECNDRSHLPHGWGRWLRFARHDSGGEGDGFAVLAMRVGGESPTILTMLAILPEIPSSSQKQARGEQIGYN
jgi:hypothetical protein